MKENYTLLTYTILLVILTSISGYLIYVGVCDLTWAKGQCHYNYCDNDIDCSNNSKILMAVGILLLSIAFTLWISLCYLLCLCVRKSSEKMLNGARINNKFEEAPPSYEEVVNSPNLYDYEPIN